MRKIFILNIALSLLGTTLFGQLVAKDTKVLSVERNKADNTPTSVVFAADAEFHPGDAQALFKQYLGVGKHGDELVLYSTTKTKLNTTVYRYAQYYKGLKIERSCYSLMVKEDKVNFITGNIYSIDKDISAEPVLTEHAAFEKALLKIGAKKYMWQEPKMELFLRQETRKPDTSYLPKGSLVWIEDPSPSSKSRILRLAFSFNVYAKEPFSRNMVYVDAVNGEIIDVHSLIQYSSGNGPSYYSGNVSFNTEKIGGGYYLHDTVRGAGINTYSLAPDTSIVENISSSTTWAHDASLDAHWAAEKVYDYWYTQQGRNSFDNAGAALNSFIHFGIGFSNAFWTGSVMVYGDGAIGSGYPRVSLDITAHETGHAVCQYTADLGNSGENGALNEGFSDIWGAVIEAWADPHEVDAQPKLIWKHDEELGFIMRSYDTPKDQLCPDTYGGVYWVDNTAMLPDRDNDFGGVHYNMCVFTHWFYLLCEGGSGVNDLGNSYSVTGVGISTGADIAYQTELVLSSTADFAICRSTTIATAIALYGPCSPEVQAVENAWYAVGLGKGYNPVAESISGASNVCVGSSVTLTDTFSAGAWGSHDPAIAVVSPAGVVTGVAPGNVFITYTASMGCGTFSDSVLIVVNPIPAPLTVTPSADTICNSGSVIISAPLAVMPGLNTVLSENFNAGLGAWVLDNTGSTGSSTYVPWFTVPNGTLGRRSPDLSDFALSYPLSATFGDTTKTRIVSPTFSLADYASATLSFQHYYRYKSGDSAVNVEISTDGGTTWVTLHNFSLAHVRDGYYNFRSRSFSLDAYVGMPNLMMRFYYYTLDGDIWVIDNVVVSGVPKATYVVPSWSPVTDLFTDAGLTIPYTAGARVNTVYAHPTTITAPTVRTYTATSTQAGCSSTGSSLVSITPGSTFTSITAKPGITIKSGQSDTLQAVVAGAGTVHSYHWKVNGTYMAGATNATYISNAFANNDTVTCFVVSDGPCGTITESKSVVIYISNLGVHDLSDGAEIVIMPNPNKGSFSVKGNLGDLNDENVTMEVANMLGQTVYSNKFPVKNGMIDANLQMQNLASGSYLLNLRSSNGNYVFRFVIEK